MLKCGICNKEFEPHEIEVYQKHMTQCIDAYRTNLKRSEEIKKINEELAEVKRAKVVYEGLRDSFKEKYPDIYAANFEKKENISHTTVKLAEENTLNKLVHDIVEYAGRF